MKKITIGMLMLLTVFLLACVSQQGPKITEAEEVIIINDFTGELASCETRDYDLGNCYYKIAKRQKDFTICSSAAEQSVQNSCLKTYSIDMVYEDNIEIDDQVCNKIRENALVRSECYELIALKSKDRSYCTYMIKDKQKDCQSKIFYEVEGGVWKLVEDFSDTGDTRMVYKGDTELSGWIVYQPAYVGEEEAHFHVADESQILLSPFLRDRNFTLTNVSTDFLETLKGASEENPIKVKATKITIKQEGSPSIEIFELL